MRIRPHIRRLMDAWLNQVDERWAFYAEAMRDGCGDRYWATDDPTLVDDLRWLDFRLRAWLTLRYEGAYWRTHKLLTRKGLLAA